MEKSSIPEVVVERLPIYIQKLNQFLREGRESVSSHEMAEALGVSSAQIRKDLSLFGGLLIGIIVGSIPIMIPGLPIPLKLGFAAGPLIVALLISRYGGISFIHSYITIKTFMKNTFCTRNKSFIYICCHKNIKSSTTN